VVVAAVVAVAGDMEAVVVVVVVAVAAVAVDRRKLALYRIAMRRAIHIRARKRSHTPVPAVHPVHRVSVVVTALRV